VIVVDASVWIGLLLPDDLYHATSRRWIRDWGEAGGTIAAPTIFLPEVAGAIARRTTNTGFGTRAIADILADPTVYLVAVDDELAEAAGAIAATHRLRGADAVYVALAAPLVTWDQEQIERIADVISALTPATAPTRPLLTAT
jgi:predicted nucleic acid-binding protein